MHLGFFDNIDVSGQVKLVIIPPSNIDYVKVPMYWQHAEHRLCSRGVGAWHSLLASDVPCHGQSDLQHASRHRSTCWWRTLHPTHGNAQQQGVSAA